MCDEAIDLATKANAIMIKSIAYDDAAALEIVHENDDLFDFPVANENHELAEEVTNVLSNADSISVYPPDWRPPATSQVAHKAVSTRNVSEDREWETPSRVRTRARADRPGRGSA